MHFSAHEPLSFPLYFYQPYEVEQILLPDNANCLAVQTLLKMCDLSFQVEPRWNTENMSPTNKVPVVRSGSFVLSGFEDIVTFLNRKGINLSKDLDKDDLTSLRAFISLVNKVLYHAELYVCWCDDNIYNNVTRKRHGSVYPWPLNHIMNWQKRNQVYRKLDAVQWGNKTMDSVLEDVRKCCDALSAKLENKRYFFGDRYILKKNKISNYLAIFLFRFFCRT